MRDSAAEFALDAFLVLCLASVALGAFLIFVPAGFIVAGIEGVLFIRNWLVTEHH